MLIPVLLAGGAMVTVGAAAYARSVAGDSEAERVAVGRSAGVSAEAERLTRDLARADEENRAHAREALPRLAGAEGDAAQETEVFSGLDVQIGDLQVERDRTGISASSLPVTVTNTGDRTRSFDITVVAVDAAGTEFTSDVGTAAHLRPGQTAEVRVLEIVNSEIVAQLGDATFEVADVFAY